LIYLTRSVLEDWNDLNDHPDYCHDPKWEIQINRRKNWNWVFRKLTIYGLNIGQTCKSRSWSSSWTLWSIERDAGLSCSSTVCGNFTKY
jgi:hypothetical protein